MELGPRIATREPQRPIHRASTELGMRWTYLRTRPRKPLSARRVRRPVNATMASASMVYVVRRSARACVQPATCLEIPAIARQCQPAKTRERTVHRISQPVAGAMEPATVPASVGCCQTAPSVPARLAWRAPKRRRERATAAERAGQQPRSRVRHTLATERSVYPPVPLTATVPRLRPAGEMSARKAASPRVERWFPTARTAQRRVGRSISVPMAPARRYGPRASACSHPVRRTRTEATSAIFSSQVSSARRGARVETERAASAVGTARRAWRAPPLPPVAPTERHASGATGAARPSRDR